MSKQLVQFLIGCLCAAVVFLLNGELLTALFLFGSTLAVIRVAAM
jgi:uncharacterized membrane protein YjjP (DUF1212 family)